MQIPVSCHCVTAKHSLCHQTSLLRSYLLKSQALSLLSSGNSYIRNYHVCFKKITSTAPSVTFLLTNFRPWWNQVPQIKLKADSSSFSYCFLQVMTTLPSLSLVLLKLISPLSSQCLTIWYKINAILTNLYASKQTADQMRIIQKEAEKFCGQ